MSDKDTSKQYICHRCGIPLEPMKTGFSYLNRNFQADILRCPTCGLVYIPEDFVRDRMAGIESRMESK